jgi:hypothetical protein
MPDHQLYGSHEQIDKIYASFQSQDAKELGLGYLFLLPYPCRAVALLYRCIERLSIPIQIKRPHHIPCSMEASLQLPCHGVSSRGESYSGNLVERV